MKKLINKLLAATLFLGVVGNSTAEEWKSYKLNINNSNSDEPKWSDDIISLNEGDRLDFVNFLGSHQYQVSLEIQINLDENLSVNKSYYSAPNQNIPSAGHDHVILQNFETIYGPCKVHVGIRTPHSGKFGLLFNAKITRAHELKGNNLTGYSLVLPESTDTNYKLLLESSTDLVDWKADQTGSKAPSNRKRFYRLRAVKE
jgi:hypothetical protein